MSLPPLWGRRTRRRRRSETPNDLGDVLTYTLGGADAASFGIREGTGQLQTKAALDYETKQSYTVTVTATDPGGLSATVTVTIEVTDVNEPPVVMRWRPGGDRNRNVRAPTTMRTTRFQWRPTRRLTPKGP